MTAPRPASLLAGLLVAATFVGAVPAQTNDSPLSEQWAPSPWGPEDRAGAVNRISPATVLDAVKLVKQGKYVTLGKVYQSDAPFFGARGFKLTIPGLPTGGPFGNHKLVYNDEMVSTEIGQVGTQFDGPGHIGVITSKGNFFYNGAMLEQEGSSYGLGRLGVEHVGARGYVCRGVLLDAAAYRGVDMLTPPKGGDMSDPGNISGKDIEAMVKKQGIDPIGEGDCVFLYTGWGNVWHPRDWDTFDTDEKRQRVAKFNSGEPGFGRSGCDYLIERKIAFAGADTWAVEAVPGENPNDPFECHVQMQTRNGIWFLENMDLSKLVEERVYEFLFAWAPLKIKGGTGSPGNPVAIY
jgi:kynurenine formamidase